MVAAPGAQSVVGEDGGGVCDTGDLDSATLMKTSALRHREPRECSPVMKTSAMRHRGPGQCDPGDDVVKAAQGTENGAALVITRSRRGAGDRKRCSPVMKISKRRRGPKTV
ncbi:hypothetical protein Zmor_021439 [Zophobas morio]|uniref:Uncharacterized protein n=1 Tax=Zophobas morio TaxID=2755281 RepID=A0AA38I6D9_9CUCU|nr:hypothetical protein Zmor_021439 [Zophobas morio]